MSDVGHGSLVDPRDHTGYELDLVVLGDPPVGHPARPLLAIGEAKWGERLGLGQVARLERARELLRTRPGIDAQATRLVLASGTGFSADLRTAADTRPDLVLVDPVRLYHGE